MDVSAGVTDKREPLAARALFAEAVLGNWSQCALALVSQLEKRGFCLA